MLWMFEEKYKNEKQKKGLYKKALILLFFVWVITIAIMLNTANDCNNLKPDDSGTGSSMYALEALI